MRRDPWPPRDWFLAGWREAYYRTYRWRREDGRHDKVVAKYAAALQRVQPVDDPTRPLCTCAADSRPGYRWQGCWTACPRCKGTQRMRHPRSRRINSEQQTT